MDSEVIGKKEACLEAWKTSGADLVVLDGRNKLADCQEIAK